MDPGNADREELAERVEQLEQTVSKMVPGRRGVLKGLGAAAVGGAAVGASSGGASGQSGPAGSQGTPEEPNDMYASDLDVANQVSIGDTATDPSTNGEFRRNGTDVKIYSGGGVRNLTNIGTGSGGDVSVSDDGAQIVSAASDLNFAGISVTDDGDSTVTIGNNLDMGTL